MIQFFLAYNEIYVNEFHSDLAPSKKVTG
jgi:hypothetical protein